MRCVRRGRQKLVLGAGRGAQGAGRRRHGALRGRASPPCADYFFVFDAGREAAFFFVAAGFSALPAACFASGLPGFVARWSRPVAPSEPRTTALCIRCTTPGFSALEAWDESAVCAATLLPSRSRSDNNGVM